MKSIYGYGGLASSNPLEKMDCKENNIFFIWVLRLKEIFVYMRYFYNFRHK